MLRKFLSPVLVELARFEALRRSPDRSDRYLVPPGEKHEKNCNKSLLRRTEHHCRRGLFVFHGPERSRGCRLQAYVTSVRTAHRPIVVDSRFEVDVLVNGRSLEEYHARGKSYVEAIAGAEYEVRIRNPLPYRVAVALSVDGLNSIDARRTSAWNASKWVIEPYGTIQIGGWQMSSERARRFYFTSERDSYAAKLGQTSNLGLISAVFFREIRPIPIPITPPPRPYPRHEEDGARSGRRDPKPLQRFRRSTRSCEGAQ